MLKWARFGAQPVRTAIPTISRRLTLPWTYPGIGCPWRSQPRGLHTDPFITMSRYVSFRDFDWWLLLFVLIICGLGVLEIRSATAHTKFAGAHIKQMYWIGAGMIMMFAISYLSYQALLDKIHWLYIASLPSLMMVLVFGQKYLGARRWIKMPGGAHFQPSE